MKSSHFLFVLYEITRLKTYNLYNASRWKYMHQLIKEWYAGISPVFVLDKHQGIQTAEDNWQRTKDSLSELSCQKKIVMLPPPWAVIGLWIASVRRNWSSFLSKRFYVMSVAKWTASMPQKHFRMKLVLWNIWGKFPMQRSKPTSKLFKPARGCQLLWAVQKLIYAIKILVSCLKKTESFLLFKVIDISVPLSGNFSKFWRSPNS